MPLKQSLMDTECLWSRVPNGGTVTYLSKPFFVGFKLLLVTVFSILNNAAINIILKMCM